MMWTLAWLAFAEPSTAPQPPVEVAAERAVLINGRSAPTALLGAIERGYRVRVPDGSYWYDGRSGLWGPWGKPPSGQIMPGLEFGPLPAEASGGNTGVIINNRVLHQAEVNWLLALFGQANPGRYWLDPLGNLGIEGQAYALVNLRAATAAAQQPRDTNYRNNLTGTAIRSTDSGGYILFDDGSGVSW